MKHDELKKRSELGLQQPFSIFEKYNQKAKIRKLPKYQGRLILDVGCGDGSVFEDTFYRVHGFDTSDVALEICRGVKNYEKLFSSPDILKEADRYKCVTFLGVFEHMDEQDIKDYLFEVKGANAIYITVPNGNSFHRIIGQQLGLIDSLHDLSKHDLEIGHKRYYTPETFSDMALFIQNNLKLRIVDIGSLGFKFDTNANMGRYLQRMSAIETAAENAGMIGKNKYFGAELYCLLEK